ncbi:MAG: cobalamin biosynthesis protein CobD [Deltaproteobacteria bacterium]|nr:cobalamin biosynthesis protein CobD [Deltaproteobacteria bacterium]
MLELAVVIFFAHVLDLLVGDPRYPFHPIRIIGRAISWWRKRLKSVGLDGKVGGIFLVLMTEMSALGCYVAARLLLYALFPLMGIAFDVFVCYSLLAFKDLIVHIRPVIRALETGNLAVAREAIAMTVGRDTRYLNKAGVTRAAVETLAENFVDGFLSPLFCYIMAGALASLLGWSPLLPAVCSMLIFKVASTLDSTVGYKNEHFLTFGWASASLDDLLNFIPARLSLMILYSGAWLAKLHAKDGFRIALKDRLKHDSPNAAHAESFVAGALHVRLGGPTRYPEGVKMKPWLGEAYTDPVPEDIRRTVDLLKRSAGIAMLISLSTLLLLHQCH